MLLEQARSEARSMQGKLVPLPEQDRSRWDRSLIREGQELVRRCPLRNQAGPYQIQTAINAVQSDAPTAAQTDWIQILALYDQLFAMTPYPDRCPPRRRGRRDRWPACGTRTDR